MEETHKPLTLDDATHTLSLVTEHLERFVEKWDELKGPPTLTEFLPAEGDVRKFTLIELIKVDLEYRWLEFNFPKRIADYLRDFPELTEDGVPVDLVYEEFHVRKQAGFNVDPQEYIEQFPDQKVAIGCLLGLDEPFTSTALFHGLGGQELEEIDAGQEIDDFQLLTRLGSGAFACVFLARQKSMQRLVAVKISKERSDEPQTLAQLDHDGIVRVYDERVLEDQNLRLLYMQYAPGGTLHDVIEITRDIPAAEKSGESFLKAIRKALEQRGESPPVESLLVAKLIKLSWPETVCWIGGRLADALDYAHRLGVLHRDIKPANVLISAEGVPKLADFNISFSSKLTGASPATYFGGSLAYMSCEQLEAYNPAEKRQPDSLDGRSDLYSLGIVIWELLTGERPFVDEKVKGGWPATLAAMTERRWHGIDEAMLSKLPSDCSRGLKRVLKKCLEPSPEQRFANGSQLALQLGLCRRPKTQALLYPAEKSWQNRLRRFAVPLIILAATVPNGLAAVFNWAYNRQEIVNQLGETALKQFDRIQTIINGIAFPTGLGLLGLLTYWVVRFLQSAASTGEIDHDRLVQIRRQTIRLGHWAAVIGVVEWAIAGVAYPVSLHLVSGNIHPTAYAHFIGSLVLCGFIAASYPFFLVTFFSTHMLYPELLNLELPAVEDALELQRLSRLSWGYLVLAVLVPLLSLAALIFIGSEARYALAILCSAGLFGSAAAFWLFRKLQSDLNAFLPATFKNLT